MYKLKVINYVSNYSCRLPDPGLNGAEIWMSLLGGKSDIMQAQEREASEEKLMKLSCQWGSKKGQAKYKS